MAYFPIEPEILRENHGERTAIAATIKERLAGGGDVLVEIMNNGSPDMSLGPELVTSLADTLEIAAPVIGAFAATGGERRSCRGLASTVSVSLRRSSRASRSD